MMAMSRAPKAAFCSVWILVAGWGAVVLWPGGRALAEEPTDGVTEEIKFASGLARLNFPDYAEKVTDALLKKHPEAKSRVAGVRVQILCGRGKFDEARALINSMPSNSVETMRMELAYGDACYAWGRLTEARQVYDAFFKRFPKGPTPEVSDFYGESAYKYGQMLLLAGDEAAAAQAYRYVLMSQLDPELARAVQTELAELLFKAGVKAQGAERKQFFEEVKKLCHEIQWKQIDVAFGKTVVILAHMELVNGNRQAAIRIINEYLPMLKTIDDMLRESNELKFSPMAECRYLLGVVHDEEGRALFLKKEQEKTAVEQLALALRHLLTVVRDYPGSSWAPLAGRRAEDVVAFLESKGKKVRYQLKDARLLIQQQDYQGAVTKYLPVVNAFPESPAAVAALGDVGAAYVYLKNGYYAKAVTTYLAERFSRNAGLAEEAGNALLNIAAAYEEMKDAEGLAEAHELFFTRFPGHRRAPYVIFRFGENELRAEKYTEALRYFHQIAERYPKEKIYVDTLNRIGYCYLKLGEYSNAVPWLAKYVAEVPPGAEHIAARLRLADAERQSDQLAAAVAEYDRIVTLLREEGAKYSPTPEDTAKNRQNLELALFWRAFVHSKTKEPPEQVAAYQARAIEGYQEFLREFPKSDLAPSALMGLGLLYSQQKKPEEAEKIYSRLTREYPDSEQAKDIVFSRAMAYLDIGQTNEAIRVFEQMFREPGKFTPAQFLRAAHAMRDAQQYETALRAYEQARKAEDQPANWQAAMMGLGQCLASLGRFAEAVAPLEELLKKYPTTGYKVEACFILSRAYAELGSKETDPTARVLTFNKAIKAMNEVRLLAKQSDVRARADVETAHIQLLMGQKEEAQASYQRIILLHDANNPKVQPWVEKALREVMPLLTELNRIADIVDCCEIYLRSYPQGNLVNEARQWRDAAKQKAITGGQTSAPAPAPTAR